MSESERVASILYSIACLPREYRVRKKKTYERRYVEEIYDMASLEVFYTLLGDYKREDISYKANQKLSKLENVIQEERNRD